MTNRADTSQRHLVVLDEMTLFPILRLCLFGTGAVYLFRITPILPPFGRLLTLIAALLTRSGRLRELASICENGDTLISRVRLFGSLGWYRVVEPVFHRTIGLDRLAADPHDVVFPFKKQTANYIATIFDIFYFARLAEEAGVPLTSVVMGDRAITATLDCLEIQTPPFKLIGGGRWLNVVAAFGVGLIAVVHVLARTRWRLPKVQPGFLLVDAADWVQTLTPIRWVLGDDLQGKVSMLARSDDWGRRMAERYAPLPMLMPSDGVYGVRQALSQVAMILCQEWWILTRLGHLYPTHFILAAKVPLARAVTDGFLTKHPHRIVWSHDEYNVEHVVRTEVCRRHGILSVGRINGVPVFGVDYVFRNIDYDIAYVISASVMTAFNGDSWRSRCRIIGVGTMAVSLADLEHARQRQSKDILCFAKAWSDGPVIPQILLEIARAFPDRKVTLSVKRSSKRFGGYDAYEEILAGAAPNLTISDELSFDLILRHGYCICTESSILVEAMQLNCKTLFLDVYPGEVTNLYRAYPDIRIRTAEEAIAKVRAIEDHSWDYPWKELEILTGPLDRDPAQIIRDSWAPVVDENEGVA